MTTREIDTKNISSIRLPKYLKNGKVFVIEDNETLIIKKIQMPTILQVREILKALKGKITEKEIDQAVQDYRKDKSILK